ncbi:MAG: gamma-glutamyltransferase [Gammaproteobacteria bacterium]|nr:gamma-glutamyltransferase [Gammaproteobacteria bacterium]
MFVPRLILVLLVLQTSLGAAQDVAQNVEQAVIRYSELHHPVYSSTGMVAAQSRTAAEIGAQVLADGGNAIDAAVAVGFALAVTLPRAGNLGGGGFMLVYDAGSDTTIAIDYREMAPPAAHRDMFLDENGDADPQLSRFSRKASGVPGTVAGLHLAHQKFGRLPWRRLVQPAADLARAGIVVSRDLSQSLAGRKDRLCRHAATCGYFFKPGGVTYKMGELLVQSDLADSLQLIADDGPDAFYRGAIAEKIAAEMETGGGLIDMEALANYRPVVRKALYGSYRGFDIATMPPPSSGGVHVLQMLNVLSHFPIAEMGAGSADATHLLAEVMRLAYADRSKHLGDPDFHDVPVKWLTSADYAAELAASIDMKWARPSDDVAPGVAPAFESEDTTHFSVMDVDGNVVSNTYTLNLSYGSGISVAGAGFLLNNEMDDFVSKAGVPNAFGLLGGKANSIQANKRPLSSMTPVIVFDDGEPWLATGSPGGSRIISAVLQMLVNVIDHGMNIADASDQPRMHHQWYPDELRLESGFSPDTIRLLEARGHVVRAAAPSMGSVQTAAYRDKLYRGASDPRRPNAGAAAPSLIDASAH